MTVRAAGPLLGGFPGCAVLVLGLLVSGADSRAAVLGPLPVAMAAHRAVYDLTLDSVHGSDTVAASGRMTYQVTDACTGWATQQQLQLHTVTREGQATDLVSDYATLESKDGSHLNFDMKQRANGEVTQQLRGEATLYAPGYAPGNAPGNAHGRHGAAGGQIHYMLPKPATVSLPAGTLFPMAHTAAIIQAAQAGLKSIAPLLFDGTGPDGAQDTYVTILGWHPAPSRVDSGPYQRELAALGSSRVHVAFFARTPTTMTPDYETAMRYFDNGVADQITMDFGAFTMHGSLHTILLPKRAHC